MLVDDDDDDDVWQAENPARDFISLWISGELNFRWSFAPAVEHTDIESSSEWTA